MSAMSELEKLKAEIARQAEQTEQKAKAARGDERDFLRGKVAGLWAAWAAVNDALSRAYQS